MHVPCAELVPRSLPLTTEILIPTQSQLTSMKTCKLQGNRKSALTHRASNRLESLRESSTLHHESHRIVS